MEELSRISLKVLIPGTPITDYLLAQSIKEELEYLQPDILNVQDQFSLSATVTANKKLGIPCVYTCRSNVLPHHQRGLSNRVRLWNAIFAVRKKNVIKNLRNVDKIITISEYIKKELISAGIRQEKILTIHNIPPPTTISSISYSNNINSNSKVTLLAAGRFVQEKGFDVAIDAVHLLQHSHIDARLILVGDGPELWRLQKKAHSLNADSYITFVGWKSSSALAQLYSSCDIVLVPSIYPEPFGRGTIDAMTFNKPIIGSNIGGIPEAITPEVNGLLIPPNDPQSLADAIARLVNDSNLRVQMACAGKEILLKRFNAYEIASQTIDLYEKAVRSHKNAERS